MVNAEHHIARLARPKRNEWAWTKGVSYAPELWYSPSFSVLERRCCADLAYLDCSTKDCGNGDDLRRATTKAKIEGMIVVMGRYWQKTRAASTQGYRV